LFASWFFLSPEETPSCGNNRPKAGKWKIENGRLEVDGRQLKVEREEPKGAGGV
jgi:hypothetical protein